MKPAPPPDWVNKMEEIEIATKEKKEHFERPNWESGICSCFVDPATCALGAVAPCILFGMKYEQLAACNLYTAHTQNSHTQGHMCYHVPPRTDGTGAWALDVMMHVCTE